MFLNVSACAGPPDGPAPKTPEILNSLMSLTSPPIHGQFTGYQNALSNLLSPDDSTPGEENHPNVWPNVSTTSTTGLLTQSTSLLTPTSDDSPPIPCSSRSTLDPVSELPSPVSTIEATRSALIKEGLKLQITSKIQQTSGAGVSDSLVCDTKVIKSELTREDEERRRKRRERNKLAATKCRNKKKEKTIILFSESETVHETNHRLKNELERLQVEKAGLEKALNDAKHKSSCKNVHKKSNRLSSQSEVPFSSQSSYMYDPSTYQPNSVCTSSPLPSTSMTPCYASPLSSSSSSYCSSNSPNSFQSLLSPSDNKDFTTGLIPHSSESYNHGENMLTNTSSSSNIDTIEPTIPLESLSSPTKLITSKCKVYARYHPYLYHGSQPTDHDFINTSQGEKNNYLPETTHTYTTLDIKTNPFTYPCVSHQLDNQEQPKYAHLETRKSSVIRVGRSRNQSEQEIITSRYSGYSLPCEDAISQNIPAETDCFNSLFPQESVLSNTNEMYSSYTYSNL